jgi:hypothetical protein
MADEDQSRARADMPVGSLLSNRPFVPDVFISWSGKNSISHKVALALKDWIPNVIQTVKPWVSDRDIEAGSQWTAELWKALATSVGIICVTRKNQGEPWINFEAGALAKAMGSSRVCPLLIDLKPADVAGPLTTLHMEQLDEGGLFRVLEMLNRHGSSQLLAEEALRRAFEMWWPQFAAEIPKITSAEEPSKPNRDTREMLEEILNTVRSLAKTASSEVSPPWFANSPFGTIGIPSGSGTFTRVLPQGKMWRPRPLTEARSALEAYLAKENPDVWRMLSDGRVGFTYTEDALVFFFATETRDFFERKRLANRIYQN